MHNIADAGAGLECQLLQKPLNIQACRLEGQQKARHQPVMVSCWMCLMARASKLAAAGAAAPSRPYSAVQAKRVAAYTVLLFCVASHTSRACRAAQQAQGHCKGGKHAVREAWAIAEPSQLSTC